ncbi:MAG: demethylmenaquinone methyltransferase [Actinomycetota bacterium]|nr:demethylmenaquinone methyltransferase [Actinomycetota bacterium]MDP2287779.1 demethylmenaquinone methyltransferase [Actinomycetota bacterium]
MTRADLNKVPTDVAAMFDGVAQRYDITNDVLALGQTRIWRRAVVAAVKPLPGEVILDLAAGTGTSSLPFAEAGAHVIPTDFSLGMLRVGRQRQPQLPFVAGDGLHLPYRDASFDAATISFGLRNLSDRAAGLAEFRRVLKPGGRLVVCEFSHPTIAPIRTAYTEYLMKALPAVATKVASNPEAYVYLAESIRAWPAQAELAREILRAGFVSAQWRNLSGGIVAIHRAVNP